jgi:hypothetical protein
VPLLIASGPPMAGLGPAFARVADQLHTQYLPGFSPPKRDGKAHDIERADIPGPEAAGAEKL